MLKTDPINMCSFELKTTNNTDIKNNTKIMPIIIDWILQDYSKPLTQCHSNMNI